jgi:chromosome segregation ATPase
MTSAVAVAEAPRWQAEAEAAGAIAGLRAALADEKARRRRAEAQLVRLKEETSTPPYGPEASTQAALVAARQEVSRLRAELEKAHAAQKRMAEEFRALQERAAADHAAAQAAGPTSPELRARLHALEEEKRNITQSFNRSLAESQRRADELERQLALARATPGARVQGESEVSAARAENEALRHQLDEERQRTEKLAAKLRIATRVTDLIFKMQGQQAQPPPAAPWR